MMGKSNNDKLCVTYASLESEKNILHFKRNTWVKNR